MRLFGKSLTGYGDLPAHLLQGEADELGDCHTSVTKKGDDNENTDLEDLALVILECMDGQESRPSRTAEAMRMLRSASKDFDLLDIRKWESCKDLLDFLDDLLLNRRQLICKLQEEVCHFKKHCSSRLMAI